MAVITIIGFIIPVLAGSVGVKPCVMARCAIRVVHHVLRRRPCNIMPVPVIDRILLVGMAVLTGFSCPYVLMSFRMAILAG